MMKFSLASTAFLLLFLSSCTSQFATEYKKFGLYYTVSLDYASCPISSENHICKQQRADLQQHLEWLKQWKDKQSELSKRDRLGLNRLIEQIVNETQKKMKRFIETSKVIINNPSSRSPYSFSEGEAIAKVCNVLNSMFLTRLTCEEDLISLKKWVAQRLSEQKAKARREKLKLLRTLKKYLGPFDNLVEISPRYSNKRHIGKVVKFFGFAIQHLDGGYMFVSNYPQKFWFVASLKNTLPRYFTRQNEYSDIVVYGRVKGFMEVTPLLSVEPVLIPILDPAVAKYRDNYFE